MEEGEVAESMYFLASGQVAVYVNGGRKLVTTLAPGSYIGEIALLHSLHASRHSTATAAAAPTPKGFSDRRNATVTATTFTTAFQLLKNDFKVCLTCYA